jgi:hypothetical protein
MSPSFDLSKCRLFWRLLTFTFFPNVLLVIIDFYLLDFKKKQSQGKGLQVLQVTYKQKAKKERNINKPKKKESKDEIVIRNSK